MKRLLLALTILSSGTAFAESDGKRANDAIEKALIVIGKNKLNPYLQMGMERVKTRAMNRIGTSPSPLVKSAAAFGKVVNELVNPEYTHKTHDGETKFKILQYKAIKIDYKADDINFNFKTDGKETSLGLGISF